MGQKNNQPVITDITLVHIAGSDDITVTATVNDQPITLHVWYSHLYGDNANSLKGNKKAVSDYLKAELGAQYDRAYPNEATLTL